MRARIVVALLALVAAGCGGAAEVGADGTGTSGEDTMTPPTSPEEPTGTPTTPDLGTDVIRPPDSGTDKPQTRPGPGERPTGAAEPVLEPGRIDPAMAGITDRTVDDLADRLDVTEDAVEVVAAVTVMWPNAALGCPQPGMQYAQVLTEGSLIELRAGDRVYRYHAGGDGRPFPCDAPLPDVPQVLSP